MLKNKLYFFITNEINLIKYGSTLVKSQFQFKKTKDGKNYVFYELPQIKRVLTNSEGMEYHLLSHHISFYETESESNPYLSQYHYTAYFYAQNQKEYKLHVYFDQNDQLVGSPLFSYDDKDSSKQEKLNDIFADLLIQFAINESFFVVADLKKQRNVFVGEIKKSYEKMEEKLSLLSVDINVNNVAYISLLKNTIVALQRLSDYHDDIQYLALLKLFQTIECSLSEIKDQTNLFPLQESAEKPKNEEPLKSTTASNKQKRKSPDENIIIVEKAKAAFLSAPQLCYTDRLTNFLDFYQKSQDILLLTEDKNYYFSFDQLRKIQHFISYGISEGGKLLELFLLDNRFDLAESISKFVTPTCEKLVRMSLMAGNASLLNFLLSHSDFSINTFLMHDNLSPVLYCFYNDTSKHPKVECLSVLIKFNASIVVSAKDGLPIAYHILNATQNPLKKALIDNTALTIGHPSFYKKLICNLRSYIVNHPVKDDIKNTILKSIENYNLAIELLSNKNYGLNTKNIQHSVEHVDTILSKLDPKDLLEFNSDSQIQAQFTQYKMVFQEFSNKLSRHENRQLQNQGGKILNSMKDIFQHVDLSLPNLKEQISDVLTDSTHIMKLKIELIDVQKTIRTSSYSKNRLKKAKQQQNKIIEQLKVYDEKYSFLYDEKPLIVEKYLNDLHIMNQFLIKFTELGDDVWNASTQVEQLPIQTDTDVPDTLNLTTSNSKNSETNASADLTNASAYLKNALINSMFLKSKKLIDDLKQSINAIETLQNEASDETKSNHKKS